MRRLQTHQIEGLVQLVGSTGGAWSGEAPLADYQPTETVVTVDSTTTSHLAFPNALTLRSGKHLATYRAASTHAVDTAGSVRGKTSTDDGATWTGPITVIDTASVDERPSGLAQLRDGTVVQLAVQQPSATASTFTAVSIRSTDESATWDAAVAVDAGYTGMTYPTDLIVLPNGDLLGACYGNDGADDYAVAIASSDGGDTWVRRAVIGQGAGQDWQEPRFVLMPDGEILAFIRYESAGTYRIYLTRSVDNGYTWTTPVVALEAAGGMPAPHLTRNGVLVLGYRVKDGTDVSGWATSVDRGNTFTARGNWTGSSHRYVYADWLDLSDGDLGVVYALEDPPNGSSADVFFMRFNRTLDAAVTAPPAIEDVTHTGAEGDVVTVVGGVLTTAAPAGGGGGSSSSYREVLMATGITPPEPLVSSDGTDWLYGEVTVTSSTPDPQPDAWDPATMLGADDLHPNDTGMTYLADAYEWALADAGKTPIPGTPVYAYGDSWTAGDTHNTPGMRAIEQLVDRLALGTLNNRAVGGDHAGDAAVRAVGTLAPFVAGTTGLGVIAVGLNDTHMTDTAQQRTATTNHLRALLAVMCAAERIEQTAFTFAGTWSNTANANSLYSGGSNAIATADGSTATYTITTPGTYYLLVNGVDGTTITGAGGFTVTQGGTTLATVALNQQHVNTGHALTVGVGPLAVRLDDVQAGTITITFDKTSTGNGFLDGLVRISDTPPTILAVKPVEVLEATRAANASLLDYVRDLYDTLGAEFGTNVVVCDPDPSWTP